MERLAVDVDCAVDDALGDAQAENHLPDTGRQAVPERERVQPSGDAA